MRTVMMAGMLTLPILVMQGSRIYPVVLAFSSPIRPASACPPHTTCDRALGIAFTPQSGWMRLRPPKVPSHEIDEVRAAHGPDYDLRLVIRSLGTTTVRDNVRAASIATDALMRSEHATRVTRISVRYGTASGFLLRGLPPTPAPATDIVLAHAGGLYIVIAPGTYLARDQHAALATLRFIARTGPFPSANPSAPTGPPSRRAIPIMLRVSPNPVRLGQTVAVMLIGVRPGEAVVFQATPVRPEGFGGGLMGRYHADAAGTIRFTYPPFRKKWEVGAWRITASVTKRRLASTRIRVVSSPGLG